MSTPRVPRDCYLYLWYLCARYVSFAPISELMRILRVALMRREAGLEAGIYYNNYICLTEQKPCNEDLFIGVDDRVDQIVLGRGITLFLLSPA